MKKCKIFLHFPYWSRHPLCLEGSIFNRIISRNRFQSILKFLHFANNTEYNVHDPNRDKMYKIRPIVELLTSIFKSVYVPNEHISIDEELLLWKGRLSFKQYIPNKRFGIKMFSLCDDTGYL